MDGEVVVYSANSDYLKLFDMAGELPDPNGPNPLTFARLVKQIEPICQSLPHVRISEGPRGGVPSNNL